MNKIFIDGKVFGYGRYGGIGRMHYEVIKGVSLQSEITLFRGFYVDAFNWTDIPLANHVGNRWKWSFKGSGRIREKLEAVWLNHAWNQDCSHQNTIYHSSYYRLPDHVNGQRLLVSDFDCVHERYSALFRDADHIIRMKRKIFQKADLVVTISASSKADLIYFHNIPEEKIQVVPLGVSDFFSPGNDVFREPNRPYILYVGSRAPYKNFELLYNTFVQGSVGGYDLVVVGGEAPLLSRALPHGNEIRWCQADDAALRGLYRGASAFVYPSLYEGFGIPPLEALACGCPVVASDIPVLRETLGDVVEYFDPADAESFSHAISQAVKARDCTKGVRYANSYTWEKTSDAFLKIYESLG